MDEFDWIYPQLRIHLDFRKIKNIERDEHE